ncbi:MAG: hypothetical protein LC104_09540 [Bacteroidales bacterium]|nr:hypothetical protein [Bacteroidales bacterium]
MLWMTLLAASLAADPCTSGVSVGKRPGPYSFLVATGTERGQLTCYICEQEDKPTAVVFARTLSAPLGKLLQAIDTETTKRPGTGFKGWMTQLTDSANLDALAKWSQQQGLKSVAVGAFEDRDGPPAYLLSEDADVTVLLFRNRKVIGNFAYRTGELNDAAVADVMKTMPKLFGK